MNALTFFKNLKVIDLSTVLAGPSVGTFFAELGADVIKIEHPENPDVTRAWKLPNEKKEATSAYFASVNFGKKIQSLDLKKPKDYKNFKSLVKDGDILLLNLKPGDDVKLKITAKDLWKINPKLIIGKISGFGQENNRVAYDLILQAETGFMYMNGPKHSPPTKMPVAMIDILAAHQLKEGLLLALMDRLQTNKGSVIEVSLLDAALCSLANQASNYLMTGFIPERNGSLHPNIAPYGEIFSTNNSVQFTLAVGSDHHFKKLLKVLNLEKLIDHPKFSTNQLRVVHRQELEMLLSARIKEKTSNDLFDSFLKENIPFGEIKSLEKVFADKKVHNLIKEDQLSNIVGKRMTSIAFKWKK